MQGVMAPAMSKRSCKQKKSKQFKHWQSGVGMCVCLGYIPHIQFYVFFS